MNDAIQEIAEAVYGSAVTRQELVFARKIVEACSDLCLAHAASMEKYKFIEKARTANTCSGILLEHFKLK